MRMIGYPRVPLYWLRNPYVIVSGSGVILLLISLLVFNALVRPKSGPGSNPRSAATSTPTFQTASNPAPISPLIFGINLPQLDKHNQVLLSAPTRSLLGQLPVRMMRIPLRPVASPAALVRAATLARDLGATPLLVLSGPTDPNALTDDTRIIKLMNTIFGPETVYFEYDNEADLAGISAKSYTLSWNAVIPGLKQLAPQDKFIGPVTYHYNQAYLTTFLQHAQPMADGVSWHEYTCDATSPKTLCLANISPWTTHISTARSTMATLIGRALPILISEWNYAANPAPDDGKSNDNDFVMTWTSRAIQTLIGNHVFAAMQYACTNSAAPLIGSDNQLTAQGKTFQQEYEHFIGQGVPSTPTPRPSPTPSATATPSSNVPTTQPTSAPSLIPTPTPTAMPTLAPTPTAMPTPAPKPTLAPTPTPTAPAISGGAYPETCPANWNATLRVYSLKDGGWHCFGSHGAGQIYANVSQPGQICNGIYSSAQVEIDYQNYSFASANACFSAPTGSSLVQWITFP